MKQLGRVTTGNAFIDGKENFNWVVGDRQPEGSPLRDMAAKIKVHRIAEGGERRTRDQAGKDDKCRVFQLLIEGRVKTSFLPSENGHDQENEVVLENPGDYCIWEPGTMHYWEADEGSVVVTFCWPGA